MCVRRKGVVFMVKRVNVEHKTLYPVQLEHLNQETIHHSTSNIEGNHLFHRTTGCCVGSSGPDAGRGTIKPSHTTSPPDGLAAGVETTVRTRLLWPGALIRMGDRRLTKRIMVETLEKPGCRGWGKHKEKEWKDCVADDFLMFGIGDGYG